jgi:hypothetical protein
VRSIWVVMAALGLLAAGACSSDGNGESDRVGRDVATDEGVVTSTTVLSHTAADGVDVDAPPSSDAAVGGGVPASPLTAGECSALVAVLAEPAPSEFLGGRRGSDAAGGFDGVVNAVPESARPWVEVLVESRRAVDAELGGLVGSLNDSAKVDIEALGRVEELLSSPEVVEAVAVLEQWSDGC